jgi:Cu(I)/Ag(I) efflux system membrane protein CusA/SilA
MIDRIIEFSARNRGLVITITIAAAIAGWWSMLRVPLDALPDLGDTQVIVYSKWDRSPDLVENQVTYPIVRALVGAPKVKAVRGFSDFGSSFVYVVFEDGTDIYWARSRTMEYLSPVLPRLPGGVETELGPDASGLGWIFQYALRDESGRQSLAEMRSIQDWHVRDALKSVPGVAEVASIGGHVRQYQVNVDPTRLRALGLSIKQVVEAVRGGNSDVGGRLIDFGGTEFMVRGLGYAQSLADFENIVLPGRDAGTAVRIKDVGQVVLGPDLRRGAADLNGHGDTVSGIVIMRHGENALDVIERVKAKLAQIGRSLPEGVTIVPVYDRSELITRSVDNVTWTIVEIMVTVAAVILLFLWHIPSALIAVIVIPVAVLISFIPFRMMGLTANIMSLGGIAIAIGALVDASIVVVEQSHKRLERWAATGRQEDYTTVIVEAVKQVAGPSFFALLLIAVSFLPVLTLEAEEGRLFQPLAYTKSLAMVVAAVLAITLDPALRLLITRVRPFGGGSRALRFRLVNALMVGTIHPEEKHPISRLLMQAYEPVARWSLRHGKFVLGASAVLTIATIPVYNGLGSEFMPPLEEGTLLYMPSTMPGISVADAQKLLQTTDAVIADFPEVDRVLGKAGRADTPTDPAPLSMLETVITLKPRSEWRKVPTWYSSWAPEWTKPLLRHVTADTISQDALIDELNAALTIPGLTNAWTMPVKARVTMLSTGIRTAVGVKVAGADLRTVERIGADIEQILAAVPGTRNVFAERTGGGYFIDVRWNREQLARYGLTLEEAQSVVQNAIGGETVSTTVEGRARYPVNVRYMPDYRTDLDALARVPVTAAGGERQIPLAQLASIGTTTGPSMIRNEDGQLTGYVFVDLGDRDPRSYIEDAAAVLDRKLTLPAGYSVTWSGQYEAMERVNERLLTVIPLTLFCILLLLYFNTRSVVRTAMVVLALPLSAVGAIWCLYLLDYNMSVGVWVGLIALLGVDAETGVFMLLYLDLAYAEARKNGRLVTRADLHEAIMQGAVKRLRPKVMTVATMFVGLIPIMWAVGTGSDVMKRIAAPMIGGILTSFLVELVIYPPLYQVWKWNTEVKHQAPGA